MRSDLTPRELALILEMPGCFVRDVNDRANDFFRYRAGQILHVKKPHDHRRCLCQELVGAQAILGEYCPIEVAFVQIQKQLPVKPQIIALRYVDTPQTKRKFDLFLLHCSEVPGDATSLYVCMLPFPDATPLYITDLPAPFETPSELRRLTTVPPGIRVEVPTLFAADSFGRCELDESKDWPKILEASKFYNTLLDRLQEQDAPVRAWEIASALHADLEPRIPRSVMHGFTNEATRDIATKEITDTWANPLDGPVLTRFVYPKLRQRLEGRDALDLAPRSSAADQSRFYRLLLPFSKIKAQSLWRGSLAQGEDYREARDEIREEMYAG